MVTTDFERRLALVELLTTPDPPEMKRGNLPRLEGKPDRYELVPALAMLFVQRRLLEVHARTSANAKK
jgi:hypothetical protein